MDLARYMVDAVVLEGRSYREVAPSLAAVCPTDRPARFRSWSSMAASIAIGGP